MIKAVHATAYSTIQIEGTCIAIRTQHPRNLKGVPQQRQHLRSLRGPEGGVRSRQQRLGHAAHAARRSRCSGGAAQPHVDRQVQATWPHVPLQHQDPCLGFARKGGRCAQESPCCLGVAVPHAVAASTRVERHRRKDQVKTQARWTFTAALRKISSVKIGDLPACVCRRAPSAARPQCRPQSLGAGPPASHC